MNVFHVEMEAYSQTQLTTLVQDFLMENGMIYTNYNVNLVILNLLLVVKLPLTNVQNLPQDKP